MIKALFTQRGVDDGQLTVPLWTSDVLRGDSDLSAIGGEWDSLVERCASATPFQSHAWLESWWRHYGVSGRLRLVLVRRDERLVAAAAMMVRRNWPCVVLAPVGEGISDFTDVLLDDEYAHEAAEVLAEALLGIGGGYVVDFPEVRPGAAVEALESAWSKQRWRTPASTCLELTVGSIDELIQALPRKSAKSARRTLRKIEAAGLTSRRVPADEAPTAIDDLLALHKEKWRGRDITPEHVRPRFREHLLDGVGRMVGEGRAAVIEHRSDSRVVAMDLVLISRNVIGGYLDGNRPELRQQVDVGFTLLPPYFELSDEIGGASISMLRGAEPYKLKMHPQHVVNSRVLLGGKALLPATGYIILGRARAAAVSAIAEYAPAAKPILLRVHRTLEGIRNRSARGTRRSSSPISDCGLSAASGERS